MKARTTHPLLQGEEVTHIQNWRQWLELWNTTPCIEVRHSLLHFGLRVPLGTHYGKETGWISVYETYPERVLFYLSVADGWCGDSDVFVRTPQDTQYRKDDAEFVTGLGVLKGGGSLNQRLAQKAFAVLFDALIPRPGRRGEEERQIGLNRYSYEGRVEYSYIRHMSLEETIALLRFFRPFSGRYHGICLRNMPDRNWKGEFSRQGDVGEHLAERVYNLLADCLVFLWNEIKPPEEPKFYGDPRNEVESRFKKEMSFFNLLKKHHYLFAIMLLCLGEGRRLRKLPMDERTLKLLHRFAMGAKVKSEVYDGKSGQLAREERKTQSLEETFQYGSGMRSEAAGYLLLKCAARKADQEYKEVERSHRERHEAECERRMKEYREEEARKLEEQAAQLRKKD